MQFEPRPGALYCFFDFNIQLFRVCDGVENEIDFLFIFPPPYDIRVLFEYSDDGGATWTTEIDASANLVYGIMFDYRGVTDRTYRMTAYEGAGTTGDACPEPIEDVVITYHNERRCQPEPGDCCAINSISVNVGSSGSGCCWGGGTNSLDEGFYSVIYDPTDGPEKTLLAENCLWSYLDWDDWDCNGTGACESESTATHDIYYYRIWAVTAIIEASQILIFVDFNRFTVTVAKFPLPYTCVVEREALSNLSPVLSALYQRFSCDSGVANLTREYTNGFCTAPTSVSITVT